MIARPQPDPTDFEPFEIDPRNFAEDEDAKKAAKEFLSGPMSKAREDRQDFDRLNQQLYNIWDCTTDIRWYQGRADIYFPAGHRAIERATAKQMARLFPAGNDTIDVRGVPPGDESLEGQARPLESAMALMWYDLHHLIKIRKKFPSFLRQLNTLGTSPWALDFVTKEELVTQRNRRSARLVTHPRLGLTAQMGPHTEEAGPRGRCVDLFTWYVWPPTVDELPEATLIFEDMLVTTDYLKKERDKGRLTFTDDELQQSEGTFPTNSIWASSNRLTDRTNVTDTDKLHVLTYAYAFWDPPESVLGEPPEGAEGEDASDNTRAFQFATIGGDDIVVLARQNPWWHQRAPYTMARLYPWINETYGRGLVYFIRKLQYQMNDTGRQTFDAQTYSLNPIAAVDPALVPDPEALQYRPGAKWPISPQGVRWLAIPPTHRYGFESIRQLFEMVQESAGAATGGQYLPTLGIAKGAETATGQSLLVAQSDIDVNLIVTGIEEDVLEPTMTMIDAMEQQFMPLDQDRILRALGQKAIPLLENGMAIQRSQMEGTRTYLWTGSHLSEQREQFQKIGGEFLKIITQIQPDDKGRVNIWPFLKNFYRSFGFQDADNIFITREAGKGFDPAMEHLVLATGHPVPPKLGEDYIGHLQQHDATLPQAQQEGWDKWLKEHMSETIVMLRDDPQFLQQMQQQMQDAQGVPPEAPQPPGAGGPPQPAMGPPQSPAGPGVPPGPASLPSPPGAGGPPPGSMLAARLAAVQRARGGR
jgi:hypothetical protein